MEYYLSVIVAFGALYAILGLGFNLQWGHTGLLNLGFVAFFAIGAYVSALLTVSGWPMLVGLICAGVAAGAAAYPIGRITLRLEDQYFAIVTLGFSEVVRISIIQIEALGGARGIRNIPFLLGSLPTDIKPFAQAVLMAAVALLVVVLLSALTGSPYGRVLRAIADSPIATQALGKPVGSYKMVTIVLGSVIAGIAGALYAHYVGYIGPLQFSLSLTFLVLTGVAVGGSSHLGAAMGTVLFLGLLEATRFLSDLGLELTRVAQLRLVLSGIVLIVVMQVRREGLWPYHPKRGSANDA